MENKVVNLELKTNVEESIAGLKALKKELKNVAVGSQEFKEIYNQIDDLEDKLKSAKNTSSDWVDSLEQAGGPLGMVGAGLNKAKVATQSFGGALKATGIGLFVSLIGGLVAAFSENEGAMKKIQPLIDGLKKAFQGVFRAVEPLFNTFVDLATDALPYVTKGIGMVYSAMMAYFTFLKEAGGGAMKILKGVFTLDADAISAGIDQVGGSFKKTTQAYGESMKRFESGSKELTETEKAEAEKREENRKKALEKKEANEEKAKQKAIEKAKAEAEALQKIKDEANKEAIRQGESYREQLENAQKTEADAKKANADALLTEQELALQKENEAFELKKANAIKYGTDYQEIERQHLNALNDINLTAQNKKYADEKAAEDTKLAEKIEREKLVHDTLIGIASNLANGLDAIESLGNKKSKAAAAIKKGIALVDLSISTATALGSAVKEARAAGAAAQAMFPTVPGAGIVASIASYASSAAMVIGNITKAKALLGGGDGGGGSISSAASGGGTPSAPQFNVIGASGQNQIAQSIGNQNQQPVQAYVVAGAVTTGQALNRNIISNASMG